MVDLSAPPEQTCEVEKMKDQAFITAYKVDTVEVTTDVFLLRTRSALQKLELRMGLVSEAFIEALAQVCVDACLKGMGRMMDAKALVYLLRRIAVKIAAKATKIESGL